jgi:hypothetical protein
MSVGSPEMGNRRSNPLRGFVDVMSEMNRMREVGFGGYDLDHVDRERIHANAWIPNADVFARGDDSRVFARSVRSGTGRRVLNISTERKKVRAI